MQHSIILNDLQMTALNSIEQTSDNVLILGSAGTGKSTFIQHLKATSSKKIICVCPTAVSALNIGGQTVHSLFQIAPRDFIFPEFLKLKAKPRNVLASADLLVIDEISMVSPDLLDAMDILARQARKNQSPFGGLQILAIGDLFQLPPVITKAAEPYYESEYGNKQAYFFDSHVYSRMKCTQLSFDFVYRQNDEELLIHLTALRNKHTKDSIEFFNSLKIEDIERLKNAVIITPYRVVAENINNARLAEINAPETLYRGKITGNFGGDLPAPENLVLKVGTHVVFARNDTRHRWHNGSMGTIIELNKTIKVKLFSTNEIVEVKPEKWEKIEYSHDETNNNKLIENEVGAYEQFPLILGYAMTIHKAQGKTLDSVIIDMSRGAFTHGQTYVALSRTRKASDMHMVSPLREKDIIFDQRIVDFYNQ